MKVTKIVIDSMFGIEHCELDGKPVEILGAKGTGKTSIIDSIRLALTNQSARSYVVQQGKNESHILIQTDTGIDIERKKNLEKSDSLKVTDLDKKVSSPQTFLNDIFTPLQLNPIEFVGWDTQKQNRMILNLIRFDWDMQWIQEQFGETPPEINYGQHILAVLADICKENGYYWKKRWEATKTELYKRQTVEEISTKIPPNYNLNFWKEYDLTTQYNELNQRKSHNSKVERANNFINDYENKVRGLEGIRDSKLSVEELSISAERTSLETTIERLKGEIAMHTEKLNSLEEKLQSKKEVILAEFFAEKNQISSSLELAEEYANKECLQTEALESEITEATKMKEYISEYQLMLTYIQECEEFKAESKRYDQKINHARKLPGTILQNCELPIDGLTVVNGVPLIHGLPIDNLSDGEKIDFCVDVALSQESKLKMILLNGAEALDETSRNQIYEKCKAKGVQVIATRTTDDSELTIIEL